MPKLVEVAIANYSVALGNRIALESKSLKIDDALRKARQSEKLAWQELQAAKEEALEAKVN